MTELAFVFLEQGFSATSPSEDKDDLTGYNKLFPPNWKQEENY